MKAVALAVIAILIALAALHLYWGFGGRWPGRDDADLLARVAGVRGAKMFGLLPCAAVAGALLTTAYLVAARLGAPQFGTPHLLWEIGYWGAASVFLLRGIAAYVPGVYAYALGTPFYDLNRLYYAPLCLAIAGAMALGHR